MAIVDYDDIGDRYTRGRRTDPRWMAQIELALGRASTLVDVGAGTGSYEPSSRAVVAVEPSTVMLSQRPPSAAPAVRAVAEALPFADNTFDAALAVLTLHHWSDLERGLGELQRVASRRVILLHEPTPPFWLTRDYLPGLARAHQTSVPTVARVANQLGPVEVWPLFVPRDMIDGVLAAYWARPHAYLDPDVQANASSLARLVAEDPHELAEGLANLQRDLEDGTWHRHNAELLDLDEYDAGYKLIISEAMP